MWKNIIFIICINELHWIMKMKQTVCPFAWLKASAGSECWYSAATLLWSICRCNTFPQVTLYCETCPTQTWRNKVCMHNCRQSLFAITCCLLLEQVSEAASKYYVAFSVIFRVDFFMLCPLVIWILKSCFVLYDQCLFESLYEEEEKTACNIMMPKESGRA